MKTQAIFLTAIGLLFAASLGYSAEKDKSNGFIKEWRGHTAKQEKPSKTVISDEKAWAAAWDAMYGNMHPKNPLPNIDFTKHSIVAVFMGMKMSGGYSIKISTIEENGKERLVTVKETSPPKGGMVTMALTSPFHVVVIAKSEKAIKFAK